MFQRRPLQGSFSKESCLHCWLPPQEDSKLCRTCTRLFTEKAPPSEVEWIRYHTSNPIECKKYQRALQKNEIKTHVIPEECLNCCLYLLKHPNHIAAHSMILSLLSVNSHDFLMERFKTWYHENREVFFEFIVCALGLMWRDEAAQKKILNATIQAGSEQKRRWILEELVCYPPALEYMLHSSPRIAPHLSFTMFGLFERFEEAWAFWESMIPAAKRRIRFRCLRYKEELMARTWHPHRFLVWCSDLEERQEVWENWGLRI
jgi:hypothetical protein